MSTLIKLRRDTAANWAATDPVLQLGEPGYDTTNNELRIGDGTTAWSGLTPISGGGGGAGLPLANGTSNFNIATVNGNATVTSAGNTWTFGTDGMLSFPNNELWGAVDQDFAIRTTSTDPGNVDADLDIYAADDLRLYAEGDEMQLYANTNVQIQTSYNVSSHNWQFSSDGTMLFPTLTVNLHNGGNQSGQVLQFGDDSQQVIITGPAPAVDINAQRLIIQGQAGNGNGEGGDVYVWAGDADGNGGDIKIYAGDADNVTAGTGGYVNIDGGAGYDQGGAITLEGGSSTNGAGGEVNLYGGYGATGGDISIQGGSGSAGPGGAVTIQGGASSNGLSQYGNVGISAGSSNWTFDNVGNITLPADGTIQTAIGSNGNIHIHPDGTGIVEIRGNSAGALVKVTGDEVNSFNRIEVDTYGNTDSLGGAFTGTFSRGTPTAPEAVQNQDRLAVFTAKGYDGTVLSQPAAQITVDAVGNWTPSNHATHISIYTTPQNSTTQQEVIRIYAVGDLHQIIGNIVVEEGWIKTNPVPVGNLAVPADAGMGAKTFVTDADTRTWGNIAVGGAGNAVPVWCDGTNWYIG